MFYSFIFDVRSAYPIHVGASKIFNSSYRTSRLEVLIDYIRGLYFSGINEYSAIICYNIISSERAKVCDIYIDKVIYLKDIDYLI